MDCMEHPLKGRKQSPEHIAARVAARRRNNTYSTEAHKAAVNDPEYKRRQAQRTKERWVAGEFQDRVVRQTGRPLLEETKAKMAETRRRMWAEGRYANRKPATRRAVSKMERSLAPYLARLGYRHTEERDCFISCEDRIRMPDYVDTEGRRVFELFGCFWHHPDDEQIWIEQYAKKGWECTVLWEDELRDWLEQHQDLVDPKTHEAAMKTSRARHRYPHRGNNQITHSTSL